MQTIAEYIKNITTEQYVSLFIALTLFGIVRNIAYRFFSILFTIIGILLVLYFLYPGGYTFLVKELSELLSYITGTGGVALVERIRFS